MPYSRDIGQNSDGGISDFRISGQSLIKGNCHNFRTSDNIDMTLVPATKIDMRNKTTSTSSDDVPRYWEKLRRGYLRLSDFWSIPDKRKLSSDIGMKIGPVTKLDKRNKTTSKKIDDDVIFGKLSLHCHFSNLQPVWGNLEARL